MSLTKSAGVSLLAAFAPGACAAPRIDCPQLHSADGKTRSLAGASVFEGTPQSLVDLVPDLNTSEWDISMNQRSARSSGESMYLVCRYQGLAATVTLQIPGGATSCKVTGAPTGMAAACKRPGKSAS